MDINATKTPKYEINYLRFLNNTLQVKKMREEICDEFTRKIFYYLNDEPRFDSQVFCAFLYYFIFKCKLYKNLVMTAETNIYDKIRLDAGKIVDELYLFLDLPLVKFVLTSVNAYQFQNVSIEEKLKHLLANNEQSVKAKYESESLAAKLNRKNNPSWKAARVEIIAPEIGGNADIIPYYDLEFTLQRLSIEQKLDIIHFTICALNYSSQKDEPIETYSNPEISTTVWVSKPEQLKIISDTLNNLRDSIILNAIRDKESDDEEQNNLEFDTNMPDVARILQAQKRDQKIEENWTDKDSLTTPEPESEFSREWRLKKIGEPFEFSKNKNYKPIKLIFDNDNSESLQIDKSLVEKKKTQDFPKHYKKQIIDTAVRLYKSKDKVTAIDIYSALDISKNTYNKRIKFFGYDTSKILYEAQELLRESET